MHDSSFYYEYKDKNHIPIGTKVFYFNKEIPNQLKSLITI
jgi:hypothetical protein